MARVAVAMEAAVAPLQGKHLLWLLPPRLATLESAPPRRQGCQQARPKDTQRAASPARLLRDSSTTLQLQRLTSEEAPPKRLRPLATSADGIDRLADRRRRRQRGRLRACLSFCRGWGVSAL
eukprot:scaffold3258_cov48-Phaeocystis_antarctica.AAC.1